MKNATLIHYTDKSFTDWKEKVGAENYGYIAIDVSENKIVHEIPQVPENGVDLEAIEAELNEKGYTIGIKRMG